MKQPDGTTIFALIKDFRIDDGVLYSTKISEFYGINEFVTLEFVDCEPHKFIALGSFILEEYNYPEF